MGYFSNFIDNLISTTALEYIAVLFGIISPLFSRRENILVYPTGIISVTIYVYLCYQQGIFAEMGINIFYFFMSIYGWIVWTNKKGNNVQLKITKLNKAEWILTIISLMILFLLLLFILKEFTSSNVPYFDALSTSIFIIGMILMAFKKIENWWAWILGNIMSIPLFIYKGYALTGLQYIVLAIIAVLGLITWQQKMIQQSKTLQ